MVQERLLRNAEYILTSGLGRDHLTTEQMQATRALASSVDVMMQGTWGSTRCFQNTANQEQGTAVGQQAQGQRTPQEHPSPTRSTTVRTQQQVPQGQATSPTIKGPRQQKPQGQAT